jgi:hypothetical protein
MLKPANSCSPETLKGDVGPGDFWLCFFGAAVLVVAGVLWTDRGPLVEKTDFSINYVGAYLVRTGRGADLYDLQVQKRAMASMFQDPNPLIYDHPAFEALIISPLGGLSYKTAYLVWGLVNAFVWLVLLYLLRTYAPVPRNAPGYFALWFAFAPLSVALFQGQTSLMLLLIYSLTFINLRRQHDLTAGVCLALGLFKFQFVLPLALIFLFRRQWRFITGFSIAAAGLGVLSVIAVGLHGMLAYARLLLKIVHNPDNSSYGKALDMPTVQGLVYGILGKSVRPWTLSLLVAAISLFLILWVAWRWQQHDDGKRTEASMDVMFAAAVAVSLVTGFHMNIHDISPLILAILLVVAHFPGRERMALRVALSTTLTLFYIPVLYFVLLAWHGLYLLSCALIVFAMGALSIARTRQRGVQYNSAFPSLASPTE